jgi:RNA exonuclease 4
MAIIQTNDAHRPRQDLSYAQVQSQHLHSELDWSDHSAASTSSTSSDSSSAQYKHSYKKRELPGHTSYVAMDCEMVESTTGESMCARVVLLDWKGRALLDSFVAPVQTVGDYRTHVSGITPDQLLNAPSFDEVRDLVSIALQDKILVGHALENDLAALKLEHPQCMVRDTAYYVPFQRQNYQGLLVPRKLKELAAERLGQKIQDPSRPHDPHEDAKAALNLYKQHRPRWEACVASQTQKELKELRRLQRIQLQQQQVYARQQQYYYNMMVVQQQQQHQVQQQVQPLPPHFLPHTVMSVTY